MRKFGYLALFAGMIGLLLTSRVAAQEAPRVEVFGGAAYANASLVSGRSSLGGWDAAADFNFTRALGVTADFSGLYGGSTTSTLPIGVCPTPPCAPGTISFDGHMHTFLAGPRYAYRMEKVTLFGHVLLGGGRLAGTTVFTNVALPPGVPARFSSAESGFALAIGGGMDYALTPRLAFRTQADYLQTHFSSSTQHDVRVSAGIVFRFGRT